MVPVPYNVMYARNDINMRERPKPKYIQFVYLNIKYLKYFRFTLSYSYI
jgi:hypothetical protein